MENNRFSSTKTQMVNDPYEKISLREKLCYTMITMGPAPLLNLMSTFLMIFYTNVVGLNPATVATLFLISRLMDAINDPIVGFVLDRLPRSKMGKFRHLLIIGSVICCLNFILVWFGPAMIPVGKVVIAYITYLAIGITYDIMDIAKNSMLSVLTPNIKERAGLSQFSTIGTLLGSTVVGIVAPLILAAGNQSLQAYQQLIIICSIFVVSFCTLGSLGVKERVVPVKENHSYNVKEYFQILGEKPVVAIMLFNILNAIGNYINTGLNAYYFTYVVNDLTILSSMSMIGLVAMIPGVMISKWVASKIGHKNTIIVAFVLIIISFVFRLVAPTALLNIYVGNLLMRFSTGFYMPAMSVLGTQNVDFIEYKRKVRSEAAIASLSSFVSKLGASIGGALPGYILAATGFVAGAKIQPQSVLDGITFWSLGVPILFFVIGIFVLKFLHKVDYETVRTTLDQRRAESMETTTTV